MISKCLRTLASVVTALSLTASVPGGLWARPPKGDADDYPTKTPIKHLVVIFQENVSFDHYFATYPHAWNQTAGEPKFIAKDDTPRVNNLLSGGLLTSNPNTTQPFRLGRNEAVTCDQDHNYNDEQTAFDHGLMDNFVAAVGSGNGNGNGTVPNPVPAGFQNPLGKTITPGGLFQQGQYYQAASTSFSGWCYDAGKGKGVVMGYYDGNTVTAFWNYAQNFAMSDNSYSTTFGPSAPGAINLVSGNTFSATMVATRPNGTATAPAGNIWGGRAGGMVGALIGDARPYYDDCVASNSELQTVSQVYMNVTAGVPANVGDLMGDAGFPNPAHKITWGWFAGGFAPTKSATSTTLAVCGSAGSGIAGFGAGPAPDNETTVGDYIPHHEPFEYYLSSTNQHHVRPSSVSKIGKDDGAVNHQYDISDFFAALKNGNLPAVSFLKAPSWADGHPGYSDPLDEQKFVVNTINALMASDEWQETAVVILYDDSDGWYDHTMDPVVNQSGISGGLDDFLSAPGFCGATPGEGIEGRCGYGPRQPLLVISPWAKANYVSHKITDQSSVLRFIEDNFLEGERIANSNDAKAGTLDDMFDFDDKDSDGRWSREKDEQHHRTLILNPDTGEQVDFDRR